MTKQFIAGFQDWITFKRLINVIQHINRIKKKKSYDCPNWYKAQHSFMINTLCKLGIERNVPNLTKGTYKTPIANTILSVEILNSPATLVNNWEQEIMFVFTTSIQCYSGGAN